MGPLGGVPGNGGRSQSGGGFSMGTSFGGFGRPSPGGGGGTVLNINPGLKNGMMLSLG